MPAIAFSRRPWSLWCQEFTFISYCCVMNYHHLCTLKQHKFILMQFCRSEVCMGLTDRSTLSLVRKKKSMWWPTWALIWRFWVRIHVGEWLFHSTLLTLHVSSKSHWQKPGLWLIWALVECLWSSQNRRRWEDDRELLRGHFPLDLSPLGDFQNTVARHLPSYDEVWDFVACHFPP